MNLQQIFQYASAVQQVAVNDYPRIALWHTDTCTRCGKTFTRADVENAADPDHIVILADPRIAEPMVIVSCEGYRLINPNYVGIASDGWQDWTEVAR